MYFGRSVLLVLVLVCIGAYVYTYEFDLLYYWKGSTDSVTIATNFTLLKSDGVTHKQLAVISATYFEDDPSYGKNAMVLLVIAENLVDYDLWCWSKSGEQSVLRPLNSTPITQLGKKPCRWNSRLALCTVAAEPTTFALTDSIGETFLKIPFRRPIETKHDVVACYAPIFYNDRWQTLIALLEVHRQFGVNMQVFYVESALTAIMKFLSVYVKQNLAYVEPWHSTPVNLSAPHLSYDPNKELAFRNQVGGQTDCLIHFKQSAEFIIFTDVDEILFPRLGKTYLEEFQYLAKQHPNAGAFSYLRVHATFTKSSGPSTYSVQSLLKGSVLKGATPHKCVGRASRITTNYYHACKQDPGYDHIKVSKSENFMLHLRYESKTIPRTIRNLTYERPRSFLVSDTMLTKIERGFRAFMQKHVSNEFAGLSSKEYYYDVFFDCYFWLARMNMASKGRINFCPGPAQCKIPKIPDLECSVASVPYTYGTLNSSTTIHYRLATGHLRHSTSGC